MAGTEIRTQVAEEDTEDLLVCFLYCTEAVRLQLQKYIRLRFRISNVQFFWAWSCSGHMKI